MPDHKVRSALEGILVYGIDRGYFLVDDEGYAYQVPEYLFRPLQSVTRLADLVRKRVRVTIEEVDGVA